MHIIFSKLPHADMKMYPENYLPYIFSNLPLQARVHALLQSLCFVFLNILWLDLVRYSVNNSVTFRAVTKSLFVDLVMHEFEKDLKGFGRSTAFSNVLPCNCYCRF